MDVDRIAPDRLEDHVQRAAQLREGEAAQARLIAALRNPDLYGEGCAQVTELQTHISYVLLTGKFAYKIKKSVNPGFLDFTTLAARRSYCEQELRLNRRLAPDLYLEVIPITGSIEAPVIGGEGAAIEYAVKMREFPQAALASASLERGDLTAAEVDALAKRVAGFHASADVAAADGPYGRGGDILRLAMQNFMRLRALPHTAEETDELDALARWTEHEYAKCQTAFGERLLAGFVRECHGDLHLGNIARIAGELVVFDCIEFNDSMRWIDVMSEIAFTVMDLHDRGRPDLGWRFLNAYLEITGDYAGLTVLRFYLVYRAMVRAMVTRMRGVQLSPGDYANAIEGEYRKYVNLARCYAQPPQPAIILTHGLSGSGKTTFSQQLLEILGAVRIRMDVERKRMVGVTPNQRAGANPERGIYVPEVTAAAYRRACSLASQVVAAGNIVIVDATFLGRGQRDLFRALAIELGCPFLIVDFAAREAVIRERIAQRAASNSDASDADLAVLEHQMRTQEPLAPEELAAAIQYDAETPANIAGHAESWRSVLERLEVLNAQFAEARRMAPASNVCLAPATAR